MTGFIPHAPGPCPVPGDTVVIVLGGAACGWSSIGPARFFSWGAPARGHTVTEWKLADDTQETPDHDNS